MGWIGLAFILRTIFVGFSKGKHFNVKFQLPLPLSSRTLGLHLVLSLRYEVLGLTWVLAADGLYI